MLRGALVFALLILFGGSMFWLAQSGLNDTVDTVIEQNAERKARSWAMHLATTMPDLEGLIEGGTPTQEQRDAIDTAVQVGDVFRFKLFDGNANLVLISDELGAPLEPGAMADHNGHAQMVIDKGSAVIDLNDGRAKANRPDLYVEAYVPVEAAGGSVLGVVEVYVDQTMVASLFRRNFLHLATTLGALVLLTFGVPFIAYIAKMRQQVKTGEKVRILSSVDQITGLHNRATFFQKVEDYRKSGRLDLRKTAVMFVDVDKFKTINDTFGHKVGDAFLRHAGNAISGQLSRGDLAARFGGDEFVILAANRSPEQLEQMIENLREAVSEPVWVDGMAVTGHLSLGVHIDADHELDLHDRMNKADVALYQAKLMGRNTCVTFTPDLEDKVARRRHVEESVVLGLATDRFEVHFQPLIDPTSDQVAGFEALLRLKDAEGSSISPSEFIPIAEENGEIMSIGAWVLEQSMRAASNWPEHLFVSVNLSTRQFEEGKLVAQITQLLQQTGLAPTRLELEVTESLLIEQAGNVSGQLDALRELGVQLSMDDFGTGYSSLGYLWKYNFNKLKIDRSFVMSLGDSDERTQHILDTIIMLGHKLNMQVTAEGIETKEQATYLRSLSCDHFQGFYYGKPMPESELAPYLMDNTVLPLLEGQMQDKSLESARRLKYGS
ncbi:GGDEF domain-containing phosphodiesterase [uncultured Roseibium sp.]|uniref:putative bifunctional diguanylate cyclase/phosphodiesterase n=1 Tax=uncultured Roseibium sp. TaxID=1936171 RepID=UPI0025989138|nr:GGDEF domain-containing phosphodiesterase [uncultured Roseibium sp.]